VAATGGAGSRRGQLKPPRMSEVVAGILRERIIDGQLGDGDLLPKQDALLDEFRISRPSMREALRILEDEGLLTVRRGNQGGSVIEVPTADTSAYTFGLVLQSRRGSIADLAEAIRHIEPITAALCARREDREETVLPVLRASLDETADAMGDGERFTALARAFHERMVGCCGNETMILTVGALESLWSEQERQWAQQATSAGTYPGESYRQAVQAAHEALVTAIRKGQADKASRLAGLHLRQSQHYSLQGSQDQVVKATSLRNGLRL
jgi:GntR family transcriptional repressor for pyruvate dehydrogenase complex